MPSYWKRFPLATLPVVVALATHAIGMGNGFAWDDHYLVVNNPSPSQPPQSF